MPESITVSQSLMIGCPQTSCSQTFHLCGISCSDIVATVIGKEVGHFGTHKIRRDGVQLDEESEGAGG
ncbi:hypothetical protein OK351_13535 [Glutamicibacter sp. MNS18]|uniref:hypothetical protein n=1 Tax=Glutamicibacter sp. MNS18 TaxID=2989817 RepID=UPI0022359319|nr:hypothetical protein [Glutamicibacter sp. MNS18]MCW4466515.1 hypothetical protein [Glutamicibacter sp. MNS18]